MATLTDSIKRIPRGVWALGFVSLLMDTSSEMIHALLPIYMVNVLGTSTLAVGIIEGVAEATANITKVFSGALSDWLGKRKLLAVLGYGLAAATKPVFPLAGNVDVLIGARFVDRIGKGIRGAPRDALVADISPPELRGASFGLRQSLDTVGAFLGPLLAILIMLVTVDNYRAVFWVAVIPGALSLLLIIVAVEEPTGERKAAQFPLHRAELRRLGSGYWHVVGIAAIFTLARFSEAFLVLRAQSVGLPVALVPAVMVLMNVVYAIFSAPAGALSDRLGRQGILAAGFLLLALADAALALAGSILLVAVGVMLWGLHMALTQGLLNALVADEVPADLRGTGFGVFNLITGVAMLAASVIAGEMWDQFGPEGTFATGAGFTLVAILGIFIKRRSDGEAR